MIYPWIRPSEMIGGEGFPLFHRYNERAQGRIEGGETCRVNRSYDRLVDPEESNFQSMDACASRVLSCPFRMSATGNDRFGDWLPRRGRGGRFKRTMRWNGPDTNCPRWNGPEPNENCCAGTGLGASAAQPKADGHFLSRSIERSPY